jgi:KaiC/GvpD/RAD55 family RecA-like ATPase
MGMFKKAVKSEAKLRLAIAGPSGAGKTYTALALATELAQGGPVAVVDTEHGSAAKYADLFEFDTLEMEPPFHPRRFVEAINGAAAAGYKVVVLDSLTHAWNGTGGMLDIVEEIAKRMKSPNSFAAWKDATPVQNQLIDGILHAPLHIIATMRSKQEYVMQDNGRGQQVVRKVGMAPQQRDGFEYEFDVFLDMDNSNNAIVSKTRCPALTERVFAKPGKDVADILLEWLRGAPVPAKNERLDTVGREVYGDAWDIKRAELVSAITGGRTRSSAELTEAEARRMIAGMEAKLAQSVK